MLVHALQEKISSSLLRSSSGSPAEVGALLLHNKTAAGPVHLLMLWLRGLLLIVL